jgi:hypothetical protein
MTHRPIPEESSRHETGKKRSGINGKNQRPIMEALGFRMAFGATSQELQQALGLGHGQVSGALSTLHKNGHVVMLKETRNKQYVYVLPGWVGGREIEPRRNNRAHDALMEVAEAIQSGEWQEAERIIAAYAEKVEEAKESGGTV